MRLFLHRSKIKSQDPDEDDDDEDSFDLKSFPGTPPPPSTPPVPTYCEAMANAAPPPSYAEALAKVRAKLPKFGRSISVQVKG